MPETSDQMSTTSSTLTSGIGSSTSSGLSHLLQQHQQEQAQVQHQQYVSNESRGLTVSGEIQRTTSSTTQGITQSLSKNGVWLFLCHCLFTF